MWVRLYFGICSHDIVHDIHASINQKKKRKSRYKKDNCKEDDKSVP